MFSLFIVHYRDHGEIMEVITDIKLLTINSIDPDDFSFSVNVAFFFAWVDNRVGVDPSVDTDNLDLKLLEHLWTPDFYVYDLQSSRKLTVLNEDTGGLRIQKSGNDTMILYTVEAEVTFKCHIDYSKFPFHSATCKLRMTSFNHKNTSMMFRSTQMLDYHADIRGYDVNVTYLTDKDTVTMAWNRDGWFSVVGLQIDLTSSSRKFIFIYFVPTTMFTMTSWVSHLLPPTSYPARTSLLITVFLCQVGVFTAAIKDINYDKGHIKTNE